MQDFKNLKVWKKSHELTLKIYKITALFPREEIYGLISQMRRSASSIPTNIAEGSARNGDTEFARFLYMAMGSASELEYQILLAHDLLFLKVDDYNSLASEITEVKKMISSLILKLKADS
jgi:four helix bundle protein